MRSDEKMVLAAVALATAVGASVGSYVLAQPTTVAVDLSKAKLVWEWQQGDKGPVEKWFVRCGPRTTVYESLVELVDPIARSVQLSKVVSTEGEHYCVVQAVNSFGASPNSPEVSFRAGTPPQAISSLMIQAE